MTSKKLVRHSAFVTAIVAASSPALSEVKKPELLQAAKTEKLTAEKIKSESENVSLSSLLPKLGLDFLMRGSAVQLEGTTNL